MNVARVLALVVALLVGQHLIQRHEDANWQYDAGDVEGTILINSGQQGHAMMVDCPDDPPTTDHFFCSVADDPLYAGVSVKLEGKHIEWSGVRR